MNVYMKGSYPGHALKDLLAAFSSPDLPKHPAGIKEPASVVFSNGEGFHSVYIFEVEDSQVGPLLKAQADRNLFLATRVKGFKVEIEVGESLTESIATAHKLL